MTLNSFLDIIKEQVEMVHSFYKHDYNLLKVHGLIRIKLGQKPNLVPQKFSLKFRNGKLKNRIPSNYSAPKKHGRSELHRIFYHKLSNSFIMHFYRLDCKANW